MECEKRSEEHDDVELTSSPSKLNSGSFSVFKNPLVATSSGSSNPRDLVVSLMTFSGSMPRLLILYLVCGAKVVKGSELPSLV